MKKIKFIGLLLIFGNISLAQSLSGEELLSRAIEYHDPKGNWSAFSGVLDIDMTRPNGASRVSKISIDLPNSYCEMYTLSEGIETTITLTDNNCEIVWNGKTEFTQEEIDKNRLTCDRAEFMRNYYIYLYGLPMKLRDPGTIVHDKVEVKSFNGETYNVLKVTYDEAVGMDTWYFYFDQETNAMEVYQFFHDEAKNDGEYILLKGEMDYQKMKIPMERTWYMNKDSELLGTDKLQGVSRFVK